MLKKIQNFNLPGTVEATDVSVKRVRRPPQPRQNLQDLWKTISVGCNILVKWKKDQYEAEVEAKDADKYILSVVFNDGSISDLPLGSVLKVVHTPESEPNSRPKKKQKTEPLQHRQSSSSSSSNNTQLSSITSVSKLKGIVRVKVEQKAEESEAMLKKKNKKRRKSSSTKKWEKIRQKYQTNKNGTARYCFRRGCHHQCITTVLGGSGIDPFASPKVSHEPFIKAGEVYIAGSNDFNPWDAAFAGDHGLVDATFLEAMPAHQKEFHYFRECEKNPWKRGYHGKQAAGARLYLGKYKVDEETPEQTLRFKDLPGITQDAYVEYEWKKKRILLFEEDFNTARQMYDQVEGAGAFMTLAEKEREKLCYHAILCELDAGVTLRAVKFVSYDEALYERLVEINAIAKNGTAQVQTEDTELGWL